MSIYGRSGEKMKTFKVKLKLKSPTEPTPSLRHQHKKLNENK